MDNLTENIKKEYGELSETIRWHMRRYYDEDAPVISDAEYDALMQRLKAMEKEYPSLVTPDSPTQIVGGSVKREAGVKVTHNVPMLSIEDVFTKEAVTEWAEGVLAHHPDAMFSAETKIDGLSMTLRYRRESDGKRFALELAETRGDGMTGEDVTLNARVIPDVRPFLPGTLPGDYIELRGEVYMEHEAFERFNEEQLCSGKKEAANPRNLAAGTLRQLDVSVTKKRGLKFFVFNVQDAGPGLKRSHTEALDLLEKAGVPVVWHRRCSGIQEILSAIDEIGDLRGELPYDLDGAVIKLDDYSLRDEFPAGSKYSSGHIAYKYPPEERIVVMDEIETDVGRTGKLTFTGIFHDRETGKPARLCGTNVSRATLHNIDYIRELHIGVGGSYKVYKSGEIIPRISELVSEPESIYEPPRMCPVCGHPLVREDNTADIRCVNPTCPAQITRTLAYFASRDAMNIMGLGETLVDALVKEGYLGDPSDIYTLKEHRDELIEKGIVGKEKNTDKLLAEIEKSKDNDPVRLLTGLAIRNVGLSTARELMRHVEDIRQLEKLSEEELQGIQDIGGTIAADIHAFFHDEDKVSLLDRLAEYGVNMKRNEEAVLSGALSGMTVVVTGALKNFGRKDIEEFIIANGGKTSGSVSKKTDLVLAGDAAGSKLSKAHDLGIRVVTEEEFMEMVGR